MSGNVDAEDAAAAASSSPLKHPLGAKSIGYLAGCALLVNNITGPGVPQLPNLFVESGWLVPSACILIVWLLTTVSSSMFCEAMRKIPGNEHFRGRVEYTTVVKHYFGDGWYLAAQLGLNGALQSLNVISIIQSAHVMDGAISAFFGSSCALNLTPFANVWTDATGSSLPVVGSTQVFSCMDSNDLAAGNPWGCHMVVSFGFALTMAMALPCGRWNLDDNMAIQAGAFGLTAVCWVVWVAVSLSSIEPGSGGIPAVNTDPHTGSQAGVLGAVLFNFGFLTTVPSWMNEKAPHVSVNRSLWGSTFLCVLVYFAVGLSGAVAFPDVLQGLVSGTCARQVEDPSFNCPNNLMELLTNRNIMSDGWQSSAAASLLFRSSVYLFPIVAVVSSIPVFSIVVKYNMMENGFSSCFAFFWGVVLPWVIACPLLYMPSVLSQFINFSSLIFVCFTDFIVPLLIYISLQKRELEARELASAEDKSICTGAAGGVHVHHAVHPALGLSSHCLRIFAASVAIFLTAAAAIAILLSVQEGNYSLTAQVCALVGS